MLMTNLVNNKNWSLNKSLDLEKHYFSTSKQQLLYMNFFTFLIMLNLLPYIQIRSVVLYSVWYLQMWF